MKKKIALKSYGCPKNLVDTELIAGMLVSNGYEITLDETETDTVIINTCSFICDAEKESVQGILESVNNGRKVIVTGCLPQKHQNELKQAIPEILGLCGTTDFDKILELVKSAQNNEYKEIVSEKPNYNYPKIERQQITAGASSYIKISDGCNCNCGYCIIPKLRGKAVSRPVEDIINEAKSLVRKGVTEIILVGQDTTDYGRDLYGKPKLAELITELNKIENLGWIRFMYAYPTHLTKDVINAVKNSEKAVKYFDIPLQHSHPEVLKRMNRPVLDYKKLISDIRKEIPDAAIRSSFIVGYPAETEEEFEHLYNFIKEMKFDRLGVFEYSREKGTSSYSMKPQITKKVKHERYKKIMELQQKISLDKNREKLGKELNCIIESFTEDKNGKIYSVGRTEFDAPEIDGVVQIETNELLIPGDIEKVKITDFNEYDLKGII